MTEEKFNEIKNLYEKINTKKSSIRQIDLLLSSCGLSCKITGTPRNGFRSLNDYHFSKREQITKLLEMEREVLQTELRELESNFSNQ